MSNFININNNLSAQINFTYKKDISKGCLVLDWWSAQNVWMHTVTCKRRRRQSKRQQVHMVMDVIIISLVYAR